ncbi:MAG TPA: ABC transporter ATP-binding protein [Isosphaeraceae bacterium]|nr:ABC transporter ATP-binding protein [Isosphaeraceae bacterium]
MRPAIRVEHLSKQYRIGARPHDPNRDLREAIEAGMKGLWGRLWPWARSGVAEDAPDYFWAVKDVSFEVQAGEVIGIIGRNGAGKSTVLKMLSQVVEPTSGRIEYRGRMASLLEVGTGFHPDLTGRENIYLNGSLLGMTHREIARKFDEIAAFSEIERFLDTPVKRYSSGMYVRLAFAVAAHLEPEILIVDEVLAVGDVAFQKKCLGKISDVVHGGRTVLFVSHNMSAISGLCQRVLLMEKGRVTFDGPTHAGIARYTLSAAISPSVDLTGVTNRQGPGEFGRFRSIALFNAADEPCDQFAMGEALTVELELECRQRLYPAEVGLGLANAFGATMHLFVSAWEGLELDLEPGRHRFRVTIPQVLVFPGAYVLTPFWKRQGNRVDDQVEAAIQLTVVGADVTGHNPYFERYLQNNKTVVYCPSRWSHTPAVEREPHLLPGGSRD